MIFPLFCNSLHLFDATSLERKTSMLQSYSTPLDAIECMYMVKILTTYEHSRAERETASPAPRPCAHLTIGHNLLHRPKIEFVNVQSYLYRKKKRGKKSS